MWLRGAVRSYFLCLSLLWVGVVFFCFVLSEHFFFEVWGMEIIFLRLDGCGEIDFVSNSSI